MRKNNPKSYSYIEKLLPPESVAMQRARENSDHLGLGSISISATEAQIIRFQLRGIQARRVLEIGTLTGLSALHILEVLPQSGLLISLEKSEEHAQKALEVLSEEVHRGRFRLLLGDAREKLTELTTMIFDAVFIDGNKAAYLDYYNWALAHTRPGGLIFVDNIFLAGAVWGDQTSQRFNAKQVQAVADMNQLAFQDQRVESMMIPTEEGLLVSRIL